MGGCAREFFSACAGGKGTDSEITAGHLRPCYDLGLAACDPVSGQCRCASTNEGCRPEWLLRAPRNPQEAAQRGLGTKCVCQPAARLNLQSYLTESATNSAPPATATDGDLLTYMIVPGILAVVFCAWAFVLKFEPECVKTVGERFGMSSPHPRTSRFLDPADPP